MPVTSEKFILVFEANCISNQIQAGYSLKGVQWLVFADVQMFSGYYRVFTTEMDKTVLWPLTVNRIFTPSISGFESWSYKVVTRRQIVCICDYFWRNMKPRSLSDKWLTTSLLYSWQPTHKTCISVSVLCTCMYLQLFSPRVQSRFQNPVFTTYPSKTVCTIQLV